MSRLVQSLSVLLIACVALAGCGDDGSDNSGQTSTNSGTTSTNSGTTSTNNATTSTNAATNTNNAATSTNSGTTTAPLEPSTLFGPCVEDSQCPGEGAICRTAAESGLPGGFCTVPCEDRTPCDLNNAYHHCFQREGETQAYCERRCLNGLDCGRSAYTCQRPQSSDDPAAGVCFGLCDDDAQCGDGTFCDTYTGTCTPEAPTDEDGINGDACAAVEDCRSGFCIDEAGNGWPGGSCASTCILPSGFNNTSFYAGETLPQAECPDSSLCLPLLGSFTRGDVGICIQGCTADAECRDGYSCRKSFDAAAGASDFTNGVCWPSQ